MMRRTFATVALAAGTLAATLVVAQPTTETAQRPVREPMTRAMAEERAAALFSRLDADGDARLTEADRAARSADRQDQRFARLDTDGNGAISRAEFDAHVGERAGQRAERRETAGERRHGRDRAGMRGMRGEARQIMARADADGDGVMTQAEFTSAALARFDAADTDRSGTIEPGERRARGRPAPAATR
ncbi:EF-hand domain-containing protein [Alteraurantiacibacter buctensis]|uniref:EF-hand domain-containing protein n=1 Tax=Alteraurantiacibacter buctensis TaxID=1503981 RepID=A0A844YWK4_9SPHN|nr:EF-hand domain-containing protein [Alteraurantiacibacter buctensis]MXO70854.1 hypothetical protein [Alteraurantiacibacter buctensis]